MANENVLGETKKVLEMMEESEEQVSLLQQDLKQNETLYAQIKQNLKELRELNNKSSADLEDNQNLKANIKKYNTELVSFAQQIYSCGQELYSDFNLREIELDKFEELLHKNEDMFLQKSNDNKLREEKLQAELNAMAQTEIEDNERKKLESQALNIEKEELVNELNNLNKETDKYEIYVNNETLAQQEIKYSNDIAKLEESIESVNKEMDAISELLQIMDKDRQTTTTETDNYISDVNKQIEQFRNEIVVATKLLGENRFGIEELSSKIQHIEGDNRKKEESYDQYNKDLNDMEIHMKKTKENMQNEIAYCEKSILENEEIFKIQKELNEKLNKEITSFKIKIEVEETENNKITMEIHSFEENRPNLDLKEELSTKQTELKQLKATRQDLKEEYNKKYLEIQTEIKTIQAEIDMIETKNRNLQNEIDRVISEINQLKDNEEEKTRERQIQADKAKELDRQLENLTFEMAVAKAESIKNKQKTADSKIMATPKHFLVPSSSNKEKKPKIQRHWDSDSSIEDENRRFSQLAKQKIKMKRLQGNKP